MAKGRDILHRDGEANEERFSSDPKGSAVSPHQRRPFGSLLNGLPSPIHEIVLLRPAPDDGDAHLADDLVQQRRRRHLAQPALGPQDEAVRQHRLDHALDVVGHDERRGR